MHGEVLACHSQSGRIKMAKIEIYTTENCGYCMRAKMLLQRKEAQYEEIRVDLEPEKWEEMMRRSDGQRTVPQIFIDDRYIGGFDDLWALEQKNQLDDLLEK